MSFWSFNRISPSSLPGHNYNHNGEIWFPTSPLPNCEGNMSSSGHTLISGLGDGSLMAEFAEDMGSILRTHMVSQPTVTSGLGNPAGMHVVTGKTFIHIKNDYILRHSDIQKWKGYAGSQLWRFQLEVALLRLCSLWRDCIAAENVETLGRVSWTG